MTTMGIRRTRHLAALGGSPAFDPGLPFVRPSVPSLDSVIRRLASSWDAGILTNGPLVRELEERAAARLQVQHVVAVSSCTAGLMLVMRALAPKGPVVLPSFTFAASAHAAAWVGAELRFAECDPQTFQLDTNDAAQRLDGAGAILATHVFGAPCTPKQVEAIGASAGVPVVFDAAHGFGAEHDGHLLGGNGRAEVFSLTPTKPLVAGEGGLVATNDGALADTIRVGRDYGNPGDYDMRFVGLNGRMSEMHAAVALESLESFDEHLATRRALATRYAAGIAEIPGLRVQRVPDQDRSTWKDLTIAVDDDYLVGRDVLRAALAAEGIETRCYFDPPVHRHQAYGGPSSAPSLPVTEETARRVVSLPIFPSLAPSAVDRILEVLLEVHEQSVSLA